MQIEAPYTLSSMQKGMLFHSLYAPQSGVYVQQLICALHEDLDVFCFQRAWQRVVERHSVLRTSFQWKDVNDAVQQVHRHVSVPWDLQDWRGLSAEEQESRLQVYLKADLTHGFNLSNAPLMRLALFRVGEAHYRFIWTSHHALLDGRSRLLVLKEIFALYEAFSRGHELELPQPRPHQDFIDWVTRQAFDRAEDFWRKALAGVIAPTPLPGDSFPENDRDDAFGVRFIRLSEGLTSDLQLFAERHHLTPNTLLQGAWALLLSRYSGEEDVVFGATRAGRHISIEGAESIVGLLINTIPVRVRVSAESLLLPWLQELRTQWVAMRDFEHTPLVKIQGWSDVSPGKPLFESILAFENYQLNSALREQGEKWERREFHLIGATNYPLTVTGYLEPELLLEIAYDRRRFADPTIRRMLGHLERLLEGMVGDPNQRLADLSLLTEEERYQLLVGWNDTKRDYPRGCVHESFEDQVERRPDAIAVVFGDQQLTYRELNQRANQLAHYLRKQKVGPEVLVGLCMERSLEMVVGLLGILKAGGAYVPLDPFYPQERLAFMLEDAQVSVLLTQKRLLEKLPCGELNNPVSTIPNRRPVLSPSTLLRIDSVEGSRIGLLCAWIAIGESSRGKEKITRSVQRWLTIWPM